MALDSNFFRQVMGKFATGVTVVTTSSQDGKPGGLTVNAFSSVSLTPPLILVCIDLTSHVLPELRESKIFAVNFLTSQQEYLSRCFATHSKERFEFFCNTPYYHAATGAPILDGTLAFLDARVVAEYPGGDHAIFLGQVEALGTNERVVFANEEDKAQSTLPTNYHYLAIESSPLLYYQAQYRHLNEEYKTPSLNSQNQNGTSIQVNNEDYRKLKQVAPTRQGKEREQQ
jgi:flavin reductase (DIM6/NTAB) family NADH-FMN oxidoreductase RutF